MFHFMSLLCYVLCQLCVAFAAGEKLDLLVDNTDLLQGEAALAEQ
jgi:hypothetical protein